MEASQGDPAAMVLGVPIFDDSAPALRVKGRKVSNFWANLETLWGGVRDSLFGFRVYPVRELRAVMEKNRWSRRFDFDPEVAVRALLARGEADQYRDAGALLLGGGGRFAVPLSPRQCAAELDAHAPDVRLRAAAPGAGVAAGAPERKVSHSPPRLRSGGGWGGSTTSRACISAGSRNYGPASRLLGCVRKVCPVSQFGISRLARRGD